MKNKDFTQFGEDMYKPFNINGSTSSIGYYNLIVTTRDLKLWKAGLRPHAGWRLWHVKEYFGITGNIDTLINKVEELKDAFAYCQLLGYEE